jgi:hypothetical protein
MSKIYFNLTVILFLTVLAGGCGPAVPPQASQTTSPPVPLFTATTHQPDPSNAQPSQQSHLLLTEEVFTMRPMISTTHLNIYAVPSDRAAAEDVASAIQKYQDNICSQLQVDCQFTVSVEIFPDQAKFDKNVMNPQMRGYYAISGERKIQMVSPNIAPTQLRIPYDERVLISVHEYTHLALNETNLDLPDWLAEGAAVYLGPHRLYDEACQRSFPLDRVPRLQTLIEAYPSIPAADLFAYTLVRYIAETDGMETLNRLIRSPSDISAVLNLSLEDLERNWKHYLTEVCATPK